MPSILLLIEDVEDLGRSGDVVKVKSGYARNYLLPRGFAITADKNALRMQERLKEERKKKAIQDKNAAEELAKVIETLTITVLVKVDQDGHMYGSVSALDIARLIEEQHRFEVDKRAVHLKHPIKVTGMHKVELKLKEGVLTSVSLNVVPEEVVGGESTTQRTERKEKT